MSCVSIIVACDPNGVIGKEGKLPWRMPEDLQLFRKRTLGCAIIMGRKTWDSLPKKPLDGRANIVISNSLWNPPVDVECGPHYFCDIKAAIEEIRNSWSGPLEPFRARDIYIIGGAQIYNLALDENIVDRIIMSKIKKSYDGDVKFPSLTDDEWHVTATEYRPGFDVVYLSNKLKLNDEQ